MRVHSKPYITAIIPAAGSGIRLGVKVSKPLVAIGARPILIYALLEISKNSYIRDIIVVASNSNIALIKSKVKQYRIKKIRDVVLGGATRRDSVENGLKRVGVSTDYVLIHDAVRPFVDQALIGRVIDAALDGGAAIAGVPLKPTIKRVVSCQLSVVRQAVVKETLDRKNLWEIQTPQVFRKDIIIKAYDKFKDECVTDDAALVEKLGCKVSVVMGSYFNIKITTPEDLKFAEAILKTKPLTNNH